MKSRYRLSRHNAIESILDSIDDDFLLSNGLLFCGGTRITLENDEYRESLDIDFVPQNLEKFSDLRLEISNNGISNIFRKEKIKEYNLNLNTSARSDRYGVRFVVNINDYSIKFEIFSEDRIKFTGSNFFKGSYGKLNIQTISNQDQLTAKLISNCDRVFDRASFLKDFIDLSILIKSYPLLIDKSFEQASLIYGEKHIRSSISKGLNSILDNEYWTECVKMLNVSKKHERNILSNSQLLVGYGNKIALSSRCR